jgi:SAM-dependent methyltransferase
MHLSAMSAMNDCITTYMTKDRDYQLLDFGSFTNVGQKMNHRMLLDGYRCSITGVDIQAGNNVDIPMTKPYRIPVRSRSQDIVISGQVFEHIPFPFASMLEIARVLKPGGLFFMTVPSRGHRHSTYDLWRYYPDSMRALAAYAGLELLQAHTDFPPRLDGGDRHDYAAIDHEFHYWGDTTGVFRRPRRRRPSPWRLLHRVVELRHVNAIGDLSGVPKPPRPANAGRAGRERRQRRLLERLEGTPAQGSGQG